ncbi:HNH endonuclease [Enterobacter hormaechei]|uniref:HNH endonuclease n=1 Tax=Enterobacter hormaechei TaxID=158836 RepID=UPI002551BEA6|nr:HNH endonuclease [Enterobacter hormaechei]MDL0036924.1 HNH endonuclease [Enterobacter hormaechei]HAY4504630.1 HNH endonuclease [Escherichia coli]
MRPVQKGISPIAGDFGKYEDAKPELVSRLGLYCSYCERKIPTLLAVEHIEPKDGVYGKPTLKKRWSNFLLACTNCNSCKGSRKVDFRRLIFPDRDNTFHAYNYNADGSITLASHLSPRQSVMARNTLRLVGLDKPIQIYTDSNNEQVALDRVAQRMEIFGVAREALSLMLSDPNSDPLKRSITMNALANGFFSIWMTVFDSYPDMKLRFIQAFDGTANSGCFDITTSGNVSPAPNPDNLSNGGKI